MKVGYWVFLSLALPWALRAEEKVLDPAAQFLEDARARHICHADKGLKSLTMEISIRRPHDPKENKVDAGTGYGYSWTAPDKEDFSYGEMPEASRKALAWMKGLQLWQDITGVLSFHGMQIAKKNQVVTEGNETRVSGVLTKSGAYVAQFDAENMMLKRLTVPKAGWELVYGYVPEKDGFRCVSRDVLHKGKRVWKTTLTEFREVNGFLLPTKFEVRGKDKEKPPGKFDIEYIGVNGRQAETEEIDIKVVKERIREFEKSWAKWTDEEKIAGMRTLAETEHELVVVAIGGRGLSDRSDDVKKATAGILSLIKSKKVLPMVVKAMKANRKNIVVHLHMIWTLGELGDRRAVPVLAGDWWSHKIAEYAFAASKGKIEALGKIKHVSSIDALMDVLKKNGGGWDGHEIRKAIIESLTKLTGQ
ncbi:MAG: HEAT repeat domain-containing protein, partial [Planctomycetota bacterium]